nr:hypothetical protein [Tanacetum cinerariifolium]
DDDSLYNENIEYVEASPHDSEVVSLEVAEIVIMEEEEIEDDNLREKLLNVHLLIANIEALKDNPTQSFEFFTKSSSTSPKSYLEETNTFHNYLPEFENFYFDLEEISSGSTTTHSDISLPDYEAFYFDDDHIEEISSGSELISIFNFGIRENLSTTCVNLPIEDDHTPLLTHVVWIFLAYLTYPVIHPYLHPFGNEDTIFDPGITINRVYSFKPGLSHRCRAFKKFNTHRSHLNECPMMINGKNTPILDVKDRQEKDKIGQKREAWRSREKSKTVTVNKERKTEENAKRRAKSAKSYKVIQALLVKDKEGGLFLQFH